MAPRTPPPGLPGLAPGAQDATAPSPNSAECTPPEMPPGRTGRCHLFPQRSVSASNPLHMSRRPSRGRWGAGANSLQPQTGSWHSARERCPRGAGGATWHSGSQPRSFHSVTLPGGAQQRRGIRSLAGPSRTLPALAVQSPDSGPRLGAPQSHWGESERLRQEARTPGWAAGGDWGALLCCLFFKIF